MKYVVFSEKAAVAMELVSAAKSQGAEGIVAVTVEDSGTSELAMTGVEKVVVVDLPEGALKESAAQVVIGEAREAGSAVVLVGQSKRMLGASAAIAQALGTAPVTDVRALRDGAAAHGVYGGAITAFDKAVGAYAVYVIAAGAYEAAAADQAAASAERKSAEALPGAQLVGLKAKEGSSADISSADRVVCIGRGVGDRAGFKECVALAQALGAEMACTRPITETADPFFPKELYVGSSGITVKPELFIGVAASGQTQHTMGMYESGKVVVINSSKDVPFFRQCDYGIVGDYREVVPALVKALAK